MRFTGTMTGGGRVLKGRMGSSIGTEVSQEEVSGEKTEIRAGLYSIAWSRKLVLTGPTFSVTHI